MRKLLLTTLATLAVATSAQAADGKGFYAGIQGGWNHAEENRFDATGKIDPKEGWVGLVNGGYAWGNGFRTEIEGGYRTNDIDKITNTGVRGSSDEIYSWSAMGNVLYDFRNTSAFTPYLGAGIGAARVHVKANTTPGTVAIHDDSTEFAYQGIAGVNYALTNKVDLGLNYHYFATSPVDLNNAAGAKASGDYQNHSVLVGLTYHFNEPEKAVIRTQESTSARTQEVTTATGKEYRIYFPFNSATLNAEDQQAVAKAAADAKETNPQIIKLAGYADSKGSTSYNKKLSAKRVSAVKAALVKAGVAESQIAINANGEANLPVKTGDGVKEPLNRLVTIVLE